MCRVGLYNDHLLLIQESFQPLEGFCPHITLHKNIMNNADFTVNTSMKEIDSVGITDMTAMSHDRQA